MGEVIDPITVNFRIDEEGSVCADFSVYGKLAATSKRGEASDERWWDHLGSVHEALSLQMRRVTGAWSTSR